MEAAPRTAERVRVAVRVRPRNAREEALDAHNHSQHVLDVDATAGQIYVCKKKPDRHTGGPELAMDRELRCHYDRVFAASARQDDVFDYVRDSVQQVAQGFNCTIFAYGQTGTGKTHTMLGHDLEKNTELAATRDDWGVIPRAVESLFEELQSIARHGAAAAIVHCSYMQIYNNEVYDLLQENKSRMKEPLAVREMIKGNDKQIYVSGLSEFRVTSLDETLKLLRLGNKNRTIRATEYNEKSSRSHALLQLAAEVESRGAEGPTTIIRRAKLSLVDLAGSEKWATDVSMGTDRCKELTSINQSLSALGNVISALANPKRTHVPYRDSKLTRLLQDSLGGNTRTTVIATISQDESALEETISTLQFADRAKRVTLRVTANEMVDDAVLLAQARREIARLKLLLKKNVGQEQVNELEQKAAKLSRENTLLVAENKRLKQAMATMKKEREKAVAVESQTTVPTNTHVAVSSGGSRILSPSVVKSSPIRPLALHLCTPDARTSDTQHVDAPVVDDDSDRNAMWHDREVVSQTQLLEQIQSERRALEQELKRIEQMQTPRRQVELQDTGRDMPCNNHDVADDDRCPICQRIIDDHSDDELDACIEKETAFVTKQQRADPNPALTPDSRANAPPKTPRPGRKPTTPRNNTAKKPASPYLQDLFTKPAAPTPPPPQESSLDPTSKLSRQRRSVRDLAQARSADDGTTRESVDARPSTAGPNGGKSGDKGADHNEPRQVPIPIVHQGSKSVKALKKFQALSPYISSSKSKVKAPSGSPPHFTSNNHDSIDSNSSDPATAAVLADRITCSLRDIGLSLLVYKFRYDCWYPCTVVGFDQKRRLHCCQYEYGDKQWQDLGQNKVKIVGRSGDTY